LTREAGVLSSFLPYKLKFIGEGELLSAKQTTAREAEIYLSDKRQKYALKILQKMY
jgi:hypothetical protein